MDTPTICCRDDSGRRALARGSNLNGLDYVEVDCEGTELAVYFLGKAPQQDIQPQQLRITGGARIRDIRVLEVNVDRAEDEDVDDVMRVRVDKSGDFSTYTLCIVGLHPETGKPTTAAPADFDPRYACVCFSFRAACAGDLDCAPAALCPPETRPMPPLDYVARDYATFRRLMLDRLALVMPDWKERHVPDLGITLVELLAYVGDQLSYYQDAVATEAYLDTARLRISVRRHARLVDYQLHEGCNARAWVVIEVSGQDVTLSPGDFYFVTSAPGVDKPMLEYEDLPRIAPEPWLTFEPVVCNDAPLQFREARNEIHFHTWGEAECCIPKGALHATLIDPGEGDVSALSLTAGDVLVFEEVLGPHTAAAADADPLRRHAVRLTQVTHGWDPLTQTRLCEIEWCAEDALPFPLCLSVTGPPPLCKPFGNVTVARGNVVLVDHGRTVEQDLCAVSGKPVRPVCPDECSPAETTSTPDRYRPHLEHSDVTHASDACCRPKQGRRARHNCDGGSCHCNAASKLVAQDVRAALAQVNLHSERSGAWIARPDLLDSGSDDRHFVVEIDDERVAHLRFGDGDCGRQPEVGETFHARYRIGGGTAGNAGAGAIAHIVFRDGFPNGIQLVARNPLPAAGGTAPEPVAEARLRAPYLFRTRLERAVTAEDYAAIVMRDFPAEVQRAAAVLRWNGTGPEVIVAIDPRGTGQAPERLLCRIERHLDAYRRVGHDLHLTPARYVPLTLALCVCVKPNYLRGHVKAAVLAAMGSRRLASGKLGFFHPDNISFGEGVFVSRIVATVQALEGVASVQVTKLERMGEGPFGEIDAGVLELGPMEVARLDVDPNFPENGVLELDVRGGR